MRTDVRWWVGGAMIAGAVLIAAMSGMVASAVPPGPGGAPIPGGFNGGPQRTYLYKNDDGVFELAVDGFGSAKYRWKDGRTYVDTLRFNREATFYTDNEPHKGWIYEARSGGSVWYLFFGSLSMGKDEKGDDLFPLYFSMEEPSQNRFDRWRTQSGTTRLTLPYAAGTFQDPRDPRDTRPIDR